jgi:hypothetical protein
MIDSTQKCNIRAAVSLWLVVLVVLALCTTCGVGRKAHAQLPVLDQYAADDPTMFEREDVETIIDGCPTSNRKHVDPRAVLALLRFEEDQGLPRGMLPAVWCVEASYAGCGDGKIVLGDWVIEEGRRVPQSIGPFQEQAWMKKRCGFGDRIESRHDMIAAAWCWATWFDHFRVKAVEKCGEGRASHVAEAHVANGMFYRWRCTAASSHWAVLSKWRDKWARRTFVASTPLSSILD